MADLFPLLRPLLHALPPEAAHRLTLWGLRCGLGPVDRTPDDPVLAIDLWGRRFANPVGLAAGFDKDAQAPDALLGLGFGFVELGSLTPRPQPGNPKPRLFRLPAQRAVINRLGFNNGGQAAAARRLAARRAAGAAVGRGPVGLNLGKNKDSADAAADYRTGVANLGPLADYLVVNVSSPNTPGLRALQGRAPLAALLGQVLEARRDLAASGGGTPPLLLKIAPDLTAEDRADIAAVALEVELDGLIVSNTTLARPPGLPAALAAEAGGLSGAPLFQPSTEVLRDMARLTGRRLPLIGVGGIGSGADAYAKIRAGASLVQLYTALVYDGPGLIGRIKRDLAARLRADGFASLSDAIGADLA